MHKSIPFQLLDLVLGSEGRYVLFHAQVCSMKWVIASLYLPPPASLSLLIRLTSKIAEFANDNIPILGDFNLVPGPTIDRMSMSGNSHSGLVEWAETYGLTDVRRWRYPQTRAYTCNSASHRSFSGIDLAYVGRAVLPRTTGIKILP